MERHPDGIGNTRAVNHAPTSCVVIRTPREMHVATIRRVADAYGIALHLVIGRCRGALATKARADAISALRLEYPRLSLDAIARLFGRQYGDIYHVLKRQRDRAGQCAQALVREGETTTTHEVKA